MNKSLFLLAALALSGCASNDLGSVVDGAINGASDAAKRMVGMGDSSTVSGKPVYNGGYSVGREAVYITDAERQSVDLGRLSAQKTVSNPRGLTRTKLMGCSHLDSQGTMPSCTLYLYPVTAEGWLVKDPVTFHGVGKDYVTNSGLYYFKVESEGQFYATGEVTIAKGLTNELSFAVQ
ncbi:hypothetical protein [Gallaecimonas xiamenensis]|uniref:Lipoprotein n=1 Tax=Gallaecimonas xiamenensis 3-C-1 TaxID=745411 RepID=K2KEW8_9GAMM|nr:hypothetical protein [Gallaecimonas xiamenensis]EKE75905.1 hypothetical protein B3C1_05582 [Gallaecimonas xiamenensis 3-C-1]